MKSMLYVGATLMIGASIYGFVDYKQTHGKKEFREMYAEEKKTTPVAVPAKEEITETVTTPPETVKKALKTVKNKPSAPTEEIIEGIEPLSEEDKLATTANAISKEELPRPEPSKENKIIKKKKVRKEFFSRGRMPEEEVLIETPKKETKKSVPKE